MGSSERPTRASRGLVDFAEMAERVHEQAVAFLDAEGVPHDAPIPHVDESRTIGDLIAAPFPEDRTVAALLILRTVQAIRAHHLAIRCDPATAADCWHDVAALAYRLRMYQDALHAPTIRTGYSRGISKKPRAKGAARAGTAAWLVDQLAGDGSPIERTLRQIAKRGEPVEYRGVPVKLLTPEGEIANDGKVTDYHTVRYYFGDQWKSLRVKSLKAAQRR